MDDSTSPAAARATSRPRRWPFAVVPIMQLIGALTGPAYVVWNALGNGTSSILDPQLGLVWTAAWGLPWSRDSLGSLTLAQDRDTFLMLTGYALFNVALVAAGSVLAYRLARRRARHHQDAGQGVHVRPYALAPGVLAAWVLGAPGFLRVAGWALGVEGPEALAEYWWLLLGMPWSLLAWNDSMVLLRGEGAMLIPALTNVVLVGLLSALAYRRATRHQTPTPPNIASPHPAG